MHNHYIFFQSSRCVVRTRVRGERVIQFQFTLRGIPLAAIINFVDDSYYYYYFTSFPIAKNLSSVGKINIYRMLGLRRFTDSIMQNLETLLYSKFDIFCLNKHFLIIIVGSFFIPNIVRPYPFLALVNMCKYRFHTTNLSESKGEGLRSHCGLYFYS